MKFNRVAAVAVLVLGVVAPVTQASAFSDPARVERTRPAAAYEALTTGSVGLQRNGPASYSCAPSSAAEGNANQQTRPVMQYGQTSGGSRC